MRRFVQNRKSAPRTTSVRCSELDRRAQPRGSSAAARHIFAGMVSAVPYEMPEVFSLEEVALALRAQRCLTDVAFDRFLPNGLRSVSTEYWTPLRVAVRVAVWIEELQIGSVVDIGAGVGKFCVVGALASRCRFIGLEQRVRLVAAARSLASAFQVDERVEFLEGALGQVATPLADAYYFYNPFGENLYFDGHLDDEVELGEARYDRDVEAAEEMLRQAPVGTYAITYNGFGGRMPASYCLVRVDRRQACELCLWRKAQRRARATSSRLSDEHASVA